MPYDRQSMLMTRASLPSNKYNIYSLQSITMVRTEPTHDQALFAASGKGVMRQLRENPYIFGLASVSSSPWMRAYSTDKDTSLHHSEGFSSATTRVSSPVS